MHVPNDVWEVIVMNFITGLPKTNGKLVILVIIDNLSKYAHFSALSQEFTSIIVAKSFVTDICKLYGIPKTIVSY